MARETEVLVIGAGPGGYVAAIRAAQLGKEVLVVEKGNLGGVCLNVGCIPSKALIHAAKQVDRIRHAGEMGISVGDVDVDLAKVQEWKRGVVEKLTGGVKQLFKANGVDHLAGTATFTGPHEVSVETDDGSETVAFEECIVATGSSPIEIPGFTFDGETVLDSTAALDLEEVPDRFVVIGGGFIGLEIGNVLATLGSEVTVVEMMDQLLPGQDPEIVRVVAKSLRGKGVTVLTETKANGVEESDDGLTVSVETPKGTESIPADQVLVAVGRRPNTQNLGLEEAGVDLDERGFIPVDEQLRSNQDHIFAIGDIVEGPMLAHKASKEGLVAAGAIAGENTAYDVRALPWAVFTDPEVATVGLSESEAEEEGYDVQVGRFPFAASGRALSTNEAEGFVKIVSDAESDLLLGVHIVGPEASNLIAEPALGIEMGAFVEDLALTVHTHPTLPEAIMEAAENAHGKAIHTANR